MLSRIDIEQWPPILPTARAAKYCSVSRSTLTRAASAGELAPYGRRGKTLTWRREDLDRWMRGEPTASAVVIAPAIQARTAPSTKRSPSSSALQRIRRLARGAQP